jgi:signal transduction histidine kinase
VAEWLFPAFLLAAGVALGATALALAALHGDPDDRIGPPFALQSGFAAGYFLASAFYCIATTLPAAQAALRAQVMFLVPAVSMLPWCFARLSHRKLQRSEVGLLVASGVVLLVANLFSPASLRFDSLAISDRLRLADGRTFVRFAGVPGFWALVLRLYLIVILVPIGRRVTIMWNRGERALAWTAIIVMALLTAAVVMGLLVDAFHLPFGYLGAIPLLLGMILTVGVAIRFVRGQSRQRLLSANRQLEDEIAHRAELEERLTETQRMEALGRMASGVAHDFNNVLTVVGGHAEIIRQHHAPGTNERTGADAIHDAVERGAGLTRQLLAFARRQELAPTELDADRSIGEMRALIASMAGRAIRLVLALGAQGRKIVADPAQFSQVVMNLVVNARDAMPDGGQLSIATSWVAAGTPGACACEGALDDGHWMLTVTDSGSGIDAQTLPRIFEPFFTTKSPEQGTGLGLATVHGVVRQSGGHIAVESRPGLGTTFRICWPSARSSAGPKGIGAATGAVQDSALQ